MKNILCNFVENWKDLNEEEKNKVFELTKNNKTISSEQFFKKNSWVKVENFVELNMINLFYYHILLAEKRLDYLLEKFGKKYVDPDVYGNKEDTQALGSYSKYGEPIFDALLSMITPHLEFFTGLKLNPSYTYHRLYKNNAELKRHKDRPSCEISVTLCVGFDNNNLENKNFNWPIYVGPKNGKENETGVPVYLNPGDILIYKGCDLEHWRDPFIGNNHAQIFLHYAEKSVKNENILNDGRPLLGLPAFYRNNKAVENNYVKNLSLFEKNKNNEEKEIIY